eukprot:TRINITY_DN37006_c0_g1_i1.p1 TRINITY_DN37006_c0_g1~~TRINITY_DN37006_c0_g1_i1.p1  ORF type:complete len:565 (+),score=59.40 TRINITY_DN37006_c0_g1_i1:35-1729(+)
MLIVLALILASCFTISESTRWTLYECECLTTWTADSCEGCNSSVTCTEGCCNPSNDPKGAWCMVRDPGCEGGDRGYCFSTPTPAPQTLAPTIISPIPKPMPEPDQPQVTRSLTLEAEKDGETKIPLEETLTAATVLAGVGGSMPQAGMLINIANLCYDTEEVPIAMSPVRFPLGDSHVGAMMGNILLGVGLVLLHAVPLLCKSASDLWFPKVSFAGVILLWPGTSVLSLRLLVREGNLIGLTGLACTVFVQLLVTLGGVKLVKEKGAAYRRVVMAEPAWVSASIGPGEWESTTEDMYVEKWGILFQRYNGLTHTSKMWLTTELSFLWCTAALSAIDWSESGCRIACFIVAALCLLYLTLLLWIQPFSSVLDSRFNCFSLTMQAVASILRAVKSEHAHDMVVFGLGCLLCLKIVPQALGFCYRAVLARQGAGMKRCPDEESLRENETTSTQPMQNPTPKVKFVPPKVILPDADSEEAPEQFHGGVSFSHAASVFTPSEREEDLLARHYAALRRESAINALMDNCYTPNNKNILSPIPVPPTPSYSATSSFRISSPAMQDLGTALI